jgi:ubiquinone/menaquinone biosynthesis C-methylase UbiE
MGKVSNKARNIAERYQSVLVPVIFEPWARELIRRAAPRDGEPILDLACGTGVVTREVANSGISPGSMTAVDHNAEMLDLARELASQDGLEAEWLQADAAHLPFEDARFDLALCQQALQFFPDRPAALRELRRALRGGGRVAFCVQSELSINPLLLSQAAALDKHVGPDVAVAVRAICGLPNTGEIRELFEDAGFSHVEIETVSLSLHHSDAYALAAGAMGGMHTGDKLSDLSEDRIAAAIDEFLTGLGKCIDGKSLCFPHVSNVITARA